MDPWGFSVMLIGSHRQLQKTNYLCSKLLKNTAGPRKSSHKAVTFPSLTIHTKAFFSYIWFHLGISPGQWAFANRGNDAIPILFDLFIYL